MNHPKNQTAAPGHQTPLIGLTVLLALATALSAQSAPPQVEIRGQVFVVQKNRQTLKLSLVQVDAIPAELAAARINTRSNEAAIVAEALYPEYGKLKEEEDRAEPERARAQARANELQKKMDRLDGSDPEFTKLFQEYSQLITGSSARVTLYTKEMNLLSRINDPRKPHSCLKDPWPTVVGTATTDADGRFTIRVPKGKALALAAAVTRDLGAYTEEYDWLVPVPEDAAELSLNNNNMLKPLLITLHDGTTLK